MSSVEPEPKEFDLCPTCRGKGYIHCETCGEHITCPTCHGKGKQEVYVGSIYKIHWTFS